MSDMTVFFSVYGIDFEPGTDPLDYVFEQVDDLVSVLDYEVEVEGLDGVSGEIVVYDVPGGSRQDVFNTIVAYVDRLPAYAFTLM